MQGILPGATVYLTRLLVDSLVDVVGVGLDWQAIQPVAIPAALMLGVIALGELLRSGSEWVRTVQSELVQDHVSRLVHSTSIAVDLAFYESSEFYDHLDRARSDAAGRSLSLLENTGGLLQNTITLLTMAAILLPYGLWLPIVLCLSTLPAFYAMVRINRRQHQWWQQTTLARRWLQYYELLLTQGPPAPEIRLFGLGSYFQTNYQTLRYRLRIEQLKLLKDQNVSRLLAAAIALAFTGGALAWMGRQVLLGLLTLGDLALFYQAFNRGQSIMKVLLGNLGQVYNNSLFIGNLFEFLSLKPQVVSPENPISLPQRFQTGIRFRDVTFSYPGQSDRPILQNFNLDIPAGKIVAIVGDNGAGKSTLIKLLCRFYDPQIGALELDGVDFRAYDIDQLRRQITVLFQNPIPYYVTASENIALGDISYNSTPEDIQQAAQYAGIHETIEKLPEGYNTKLGKLFPNGTELSGGQWQRLALARSFLRRAELIILDEPTSAMDPWAETDWIERFRALAKERTAVVVTHRFTLAMCADIIYVMRQGQIVESGTHAELLEQGGYYAESWRSQIGAPSPDLENVTEDLAPSWC
ncbi:ABC transporter ATP-binding protein [Leptolyngbya sp. AN02str]|uniref:ABC transporter ATP-binding protein n=1 Tax=Leptolyngbya sp. AN02str TaxID=3423363 RepID=UPI003D314449